MTTDDDFSLSEFDLNNECNWNTLIRGENVTIPLYTQTQGLDEIPQYVVGSVDPPGVPMTTMWLRVRLKCADGSLGCDDSQRLEFWDEEMLKAETFVFGDSTQDFTQRILDWMLLANKEVFVPNTLSGIEGRKGESREITSLRLRNNVPDNPAQHDFEWYDSNSKVSNIDFTKINGFNVLEESDSFDNVLSLIETMTYFEDDFENLPQLIFGLTRNNLKACNSDDGCPVLNHGETITVPIENSWGSRELYEIEYQLLTDVPVSNSQYVIKGELIDGEKTYNLKQSTKKGPQTTTPGAVFST